MKRKTVSLMHTKFGSFWCCILKLMELCIMEMNGNSICFEHTLTNLLEGMNPSQIMSFRLREIARLIACQDISNGVKANNEF